MSVASTNGYQATNAVGTVGYDDEQFIKVYNNTGAALAEGSVYKVSFAVDGTTGFFPLPAAIATDSVGTTIVGVVTHDVSGSAGIAIATWGWLQIKGYCEKVKVNASTTAQNTISAVNAQAYAVDETGTTLTAKTFAIARTTSSTFVAAHLLGFRVTV